MRVRWEGRDATLNPVLSPSGPPGAHAQLLVEVQAKLEETMRDRWRGGVVTQGGVDVSIHHCAELNF